MHEEPVAKPSNSQRELCGSKSAQHGASAKG